MNPHRAVQVCRSVSLSSFFLAHSIFLINVISVCFFTSFHSPLLLIPIFSDDDDDDDDDGNAAAGGVIFSSVGCCFTSTEGTEVGADADADADAAGTGVAVGVAVGAACS